MSAPEKMVLMQGRASRTAYWLTFIALWISSFIVGLIGGAAGYPGGLVIQIVWLLLAAYLWLWIAACRARDMGKSGWFALLMLIPIVGIGVLFWLGFSDSEVSHHKPGR